MRKSYTQLQRLPRLIVGFVFFWPLLVACRHQQLREAFLVEAFSAETRAIEDKVYDLAYRVEDLEQRVDRLEGAAGQGGSSQGKALPRHRPSAPSQEIPDLSPPEVDPGRPVTPEQLRRGSSYRPGGRSGEFVAALDAAGDELPDRLPQADPQSVTLHIDQRTALADWDGKPGPDGVWLVFRAEDSDGQLISQGGRVTAVLLDAVSRTHVGRWEFDALTVRRAIRWDDPPAAFVLPLRWKQTPRNLQLHLFIRWEDESGRRWETDSPIDGSGSSQQAAQWQARSSGSATHGPPAAVYR